MSMGKRYWKLPMFIAPPQTNKQKTLVVPPLIDKIHRKKNQIGFKTLSLGFFFPICFPLWNHDAYFKLPFYSNLYIVLLSNKVSFSHKSGKLGGRTA